MKNRPINSQADLVRRYGAKFIINQVKINLTGKETVRELKEIAFTLCNDCISLSLFLEGVLDELNNIDRKRIDVKLSTSKIINLSLTEAIELLTKKEDLVTIIGAMQSAIEKNITNPPVKLTDVMDSRLEPREIEYDVKQPEAKPEEITFPKRKKPNPGFQS